MRSEKRVSALKDSKSTRMSADARLSLVVLLTKLKSIRLIKLFHLILSSGKFGCFSFFRTDYSGYGKAK